MNLFESRYFNINRLLMSLIGLWPYQKPRSRRIKMILVSILLAEGITAQLTPFITHEYSTSLVIEVFSFSILCLIYVLKYNTVYFNLKHIREFMECIRVDWNELQDEEELEIIRKYARTARTYLYAFVGVSYPGTVAYISLPFLPDILDIVAPLNESRTRILPFPVEYFLDEQKYFYLLLSHSIVAIIIGIVTIVTTETLTFAYFCHICGMFEIVSYRIMSAFGKSLSVLLTLNKENTIRIKLIAAVKIHQKAFELFEILTSTLSLSYFTLIILGVASLSINLFRLFQVTTLSEQKKEIVLYIVFVIGHFYYMFMCNYMGQIVIDSSTDIFKKACDTQWYATSSRTQKLMLFIMQRSMKSCKIVMGKLYYVSLEQFTTVKLHHGYDNESYF
ncbi:hypothetical protein PUN28_005060 [Cardiocondyla obscurior]|uniref:Odorant receptor n=1 Tax=Cardiocondyla obscurior TaxID=286306 RepID=A0AAW2GFU0_9HYME